MIRKLEARLVIATPNQKQIESTEFRAFQGLETVFVKFQAFPGPL
jgi:hypothetical protein